MRTGKHPGSRYEAVADHRRLPLEAEFGELFATVAGYTELEKIHFAFTIENDVSVEEGIARATPKNTIKETVRQIGGRVVEKRVE